MDFLPQLPELGQLDLIEVYHFYDQPVFFACINAQEQIFMAVWVDEEPDFETWLYLPVSLSRFKEIRHGEMDLQSALTYAEDKVVFAVQLPHDESQASLREIPSREIPLGWLPWPGEFLNLAPNTLPQQIAQHSSCAEEQTDQTPSFSDHVAELVRDMLKKVNSGLIKLSIKEWREILRILQAKRSILSNEKVTESQLERTGQLMLAAFEHDKTLRRYFKLPSGMALARIRPNMPKNRRAITKNRTALLALIKRAEKEMEKIK